MTDPCAFSPQSKAGAMNATKTDVMTDSKACSIHSEIGAIADTEVGATADPEIHPIFLLLQLSTPIVRTLLYHII